MSILRQVTDKSLLSGEGKSRYDASWMQHATQSSIDRVLSMSPSFLYRVSGKVGRIGLPHTDARLETKRDNADGDDDDVSYVPSRNIASLVRTANDRRMRPSWRKDDLFLFRVTCMTSPLFTGCSERQGFDDGNFRYRDTEIKKMSSFGLDSEEEI